MAEYDLVVIGSGAAGQTAATTAVHHGAARVAIVERGSSLGHLREYRVHTEQIPPHTCRVSGMFIRNN